jgi:Tfp pilus assembly protein PilV
MKVHHRKSIRASRPRAGFTLVEAMAAILLLAIVTPALTQALGGAGQAASNARRRTEATILAQEKMSELMATGTWQGNALSGDFGADWPQYQWQATVQAWAGDTTGAGLLEIDVRVSWLNRNQMDSTTLSSIMYPAAQQSPAATTTTQ